MPLSEKEWFKQYSEDLNSPYWFAYRREVLKIFGALCNRCGCDERSGIPLQIHHKRYIKNAKPWQYSNPEDIEVLCVVCHSKEHKKDLWHKSFKAIPEFRHIKFFCPKILMKGGIK